MGSSRAWGTTFRGALGPLTRGPALPLLQSLFQILLPKTCPSPCCGGHFSLPVLPTPHKTPLGGHTHLLPGPHSAPCLFTASLSAETVLCCPSLRGPRSPAYLALTSLPLPQPRRLTHPGAFAHAPLPARGCSPSDLCPSFSLADLSTSPNQFMCPRPHLSDGATISPFAQLHTTELDLISLRPAQPIHRQRQTLAPLSHKPYLEPLTSVPSAPSGFQAIKALASMPISSPGPAHTPSWLLRACRLSLDPPTWQLKPFSQSGTSLSISQARWVTSSGIPTLEPLPPSYKGPLPFPPSRELQQYLPSVRSM